MFGVLSAKQRSKHSCKCLTCRYLRVVVLTRLQEAVPLSCKTTKTIQLEIQPMLMLAKVKSQILTLVELAWCCCYHGNDAT